ncbi:MAG: 8-oxoguanine deaminase [Pseudomonadota bacterium]
MTPRIWIKNPLAIHAPDVADTRGGVVVENAVIAEVVPLGEKPTLPVSDEFDASEHVVIPGLVNVHHHFYQTLTRALPDALNKPLFPWLKSLYPIWSKLDAEMISLSTELACTELLLSGCTTTADHHYLFSDAISDAIDLQVRTIKKVGIRATVTRGSMSLGEDQGGLPPRSVVQTEETILADSERLIGLHHDGDPGSMLQVALAPCSPFSVSASLMRDTAALARTHGVRLHTHLGETEDENMFCVRQFGQRPVDYLESVNWMANDVWLAHGIHFTDDEIKRLGAAGIGISHCPSSNMLLASGQCATLDCEAAGCVIGIGVDGSASNDGSNMIQEVRHAFLLQRLRYNAADITHKTVLDWATKGSSRCLGRDDIGSIAVGKRADMALFKLDELRFSGAGDALAALILCGAHRADRVMIEGQWRVIDQDPLDTDLRELTHKHHLAAQKLWNAS